jgi:endogenous inhibitor of DNA gyrase (YacG/DUF329 family)
MSDKRRCAQCGREFRARREHARFCSPRCRTDWNRENTGIPGPGDDALEWATAALADTTGQLLEASGWKEPEGFAVITEAVWWVTMVDATLVRYHPDAYGRALASRDSRSRPVLENTLGGLRFVRNRMGYEADPADFIQVRAGSATAPAVRVADWTWRPVPEPCWPSQADPGQQWELSRYRAYQAQLAGHPIGDTFAQATAFLQSSLQSVG